MIDYWCNAFTPNRAPLWRSVIEEHGLTIGTRDGDEVDGFTGPDEMVHRMDHLGVSCLVLPVCNLSANAPLDDFGYYAARLDEIEELATVHPGRFFGAFSVDPTAGQAGVEEASAALSKSWCVALHTHTHSWDRRFDHPDYRPYHALCADAGVPFVMQAGASGGNFPHEYGHPSAIAEPAATFPSVPFVLSHTGAPWVADAVSAAAEFTNVVIGTATHPPRRWSTELLDFLRGPGATKTLFGTGFPLTGHARSLGQLDDLELDPDIRHNLLEGNARRIFMRIAGG